MQKSLSKMQKDPFQNFLQQLSIEEKELYHSLSTPTQIQAFLDATEYSTDSFYRCPIRVLREKKANCLDGAFFAATCLRQSGYKPLVVDLLPEPGTDDDHLITVYKRNGLWGSVAQSNFVGLRYREPIYRTVRDLVLSYFEQYYNVAGMKTLRGYTKPFNLARMDNTGWMYNDEGMDALERASYAWEQVTLFSPELISTFISVDERSRRAGLSGANEAGLFKA
jgi:hypothetical protein